MDFDFRFGLSATLRYALSRSVAFPIRCVYECQHVCTRVSTVRAGLCICVCVMHNNGECGCVCMCLHSTNITHIESAQLAEYIE